MKKFLKWTGIIVGGILLLIISIIVITFIRHDRYSFVYDSGGLISDNQAAYDVKYYGLDLEIIGSEQSIAGSVLIRIESLQNNLSEVELDLIDNFSVKKINDNLEYEHDSGKLLVSLKEELNRGELLDLQIQYSGQPLEAIYPPWVGGFVWSQDSSGADWIGVSCQGEGADIWIPCKDHPSDKPDSVAINITIPEGYYCASNGLLRNISHPRKGYQTFQWFTDYPINNYNININIGKYELIESDYMTEDGRIMPVIYYVLPQSREGAEYLVDMAIDMLTSYRNYYGEYPFTREKFGLVQTDYLGMEHQTINAYGNNYLFEVFAGIEYDNLMLHEMGHEWWGNKVTAADWGDMWIQEGICTYGEALYMLGKAGEQAYHDYMRKIRRRIANRKPIIPSKNATSNEVYQGDIYAKGAQLMHNLRFLLGDSIFFSALKQFATDSIYTYKNLVNTDDFMTLFNPNEDSDLSGFITEFLYTTEIPEVEIDSVDTDTYKIRVRNIDYSLPMEVSLENEITVFVLSNEYVEVNCSEIPVVDPKRWYYKKTFYLQSAANNKNG